MNNQLKAFIAQQRQQIESDMISNILETGRTYKLMIEKFGRERVENETLPLSRFSMFQVQQIIQLWEQSRKGKPITFKSIPPMLRQVLRGDEPTIPQT